MKIALHVDGPVIRGNEHQLLILADGLVRRGHEVVASCRSGGPVEAALRERGVRTTGIRPRGDVDIISALRFAAWLRRERPDAVLLTSWVRAFIGGWAAHLARVPRIVFRIGGMQPVHNEKRARAERYALQHWVHLVIANSSAVAEHMTGALPMLKDRLFIVPNGVVPAEPPNPLPLRTELAIPADHLMAVAVGGMEDNKGFDVLIEAVALTDALHVLLVGGGSPSQKVKLSGLAQARGVHDRIHFLGRRTDVAAILGACDLFVMPSRSEGFGVVLLEAMAAGLPIIASNVGGAPDALPALAGRPAAGWTVPRADESALAEKLNDVAHGIRSNDVRIPAAAAEAAWRVRHWFTDEQMIAGYEAVLSGSPLPPSPV